MNCEKTFNEGTLPELEELRGVYRVCLVGRFLPAICVLGHRKVIVAGKGSAPSGNNRFLGRVNIARFNADIGDSLVAPGEKVLRIKYDTPANAFFIRPLTDEVRRVAPGEYIGRGIYRAFGRKIRIFHFTIRKMQ